jgi:VanZ family protein
MNNKIHWILKSPFAVALLIISWLSLRPNIIVEAAPSEELTHVPHYVLEIIGHGPHFAAYALLTIFAALIIRRRRNFLILAVALLSLSVVFEGLQAWIPGRTPSVHDITANVFGLISGTAFSIFVFPKLAKRFSRPN